MITFLIGLMIAIATIYCFIALLLVAYAIEAKINKRRESKMYKHIQYEDWLAYLGLEDTLDIMVCNGPKTNSYFFDDLLELLTIF